MVRLLKEAPNLSPEQLEYLECIEFSGEHLQTLLGDVMDLNRIERQQIVLVCSSSDSVVVSAGL